jgi:putative flippase GtrA
MAGHRGQRHALPLLRDVMLSTLWRHPEIRRFTVFLGVGSVNFAFYYLIFATLHFLGVPPSASVVIATIIGVLFNFCTTGRVVFQSGNVRVLPRFIGVYVVQCSLNVLFLKLLIMMGAPVLLAEAIVVGGLAVFTFLALRAWVFKPGVMASIPPGDWKPS